MSVESATELESCHFEMRPFFERPDLPKTSAFLDCTEADRQRLLSLNRNGYCLLDPGIDSATLGDARTDTEELMRRRGTDAVKSRIQDAFVQSAAIRKIACNARILEFLKLAYGRRAFPFQTLNFNYGTEQAAHSDTIHFSSLPQRFMCGVWVALEDADESNGPLLYYPRSHKLPVFGLEELNIRDFRDYSRAYALYETEIQKLIEDLALEPEYLVIRRGQALVWAANLLHGGSPIRDRKKTRFSQVTHYYFEGCAYFTPLLSSPVRGRVHMRWPRNALSGGRLRTKDFIGYILRAGYNPFWLFTSHFGSILRRGAERWHSWRR